MKNDYTTNSHYITYTSSQNVGRMYFWTVIGSGKLNCRTCLAAAMDASLSPETGEMTYWLTRRWNGFMAFGLFLWPASTSFFRSQLNAQHWRYGDMERQAQFLKHPRSVLKAPSKVLSSTVSFSSLDCSFKCLETASCLSFNYGIHSQLCQLLSTDKYNPSVQFGPSAIFHRFDYPIAVILAFT